MNNTFFKSIVTSIKTATTNYFSPKPQSKPSTFQDQTPSSSVTPPKRHTLMAPDSTGRRDIFKGVVYYDASSALDDYHQKVLLGGGALEYDDDGDVIEWSKITHVFTHNVDFPGQQEAVKQKGLAIVTVNTNWIYELICLATVD
jgi:hypothetical protein